MSTTTTTTMNRFYHRRGICLQTVKKENSKLNTFKYYRYTLPYHRMAGNNTYSSSMLIVFCITLYGLQRCKIKAVLSVAIIVCSRLLPGADCYLLSSVLIRFYVCMYVLLGTSRVGLSVCLYLRCY